MINKQPHKTSCGPVAILNALRWKGYNDSYDDIIRFSKKYLEFKHGSGMLYSVVKRGLKKLGIKHKIIHKATFTQVIKELDKGRAVILRFHWNHKIHAHYIFIDKHTKDFVRAWNTGKNKPCFSKKTLRKYIAYTNRHGNGPTHAFVIL